MEDDDLYDEFGNYVGPQEDGSENQSASPDVFGSNGIGSPLNGSDNDMGELAEVQDEPSNAVVLHEDKQYYPTAQQIYGPDVETLVQEEDTQMLNQPIIAPIKDKKVTVEETDLPHVFYKREFMTDLMKFPECVRNVAVVGHMHHGKTRFIDMLVKQTHDVSELEKTQPKHSPSDRLRYTDVNQVERERGLSTKSAPISLVLQNSQRKSFVINLIDTPGHANFMDEVACSMRLADGILLVVDVVEGVHVTSKKIIEHAVINSIPITLVVNKMDRLIMELRLPPDDAYFKLRLVIESVNELIEYYDPENGHLHRVSPEKGNVLFACPEMQWAFTIKSFANLYRYKEPNKDWDDISKRFWGDIFWNPTSRIFTRDPKEKKSKRAFIWWILDPLYKLYNVVLTSQPASLKKKLSELGIKMKPKEINVDIKQLLVNVCKRWFEEPTCFVDVITENIPSPLDGSRRMLEKFYTGPIDPNLTTIESMLSCDSEGPLIIHVTKLYHTRDGEKFNAFGRILSGSISPNTKVRVLGEGYTVQYEEEATEATVGDVWIDCSRYKVSVSNVPAGNLVLLSNVDQSILKTATIIFDANSEVAKTAPPVHIFKPVRHFYDSVFKTVIQPANATELPILSEGVRRLSKAYPSMVTLSEGASLEHSLIYTGELGMDTALYDLRSTYTEISIQVLDPVVRFCETVDTASAEKYAAKTPNGKNTIYIIAEPLQKDVADAIEAHQLDITKPREISRLLRDKFEWDAFSSRNVWAFGSTNHGPNVLVNETSLANVDQERVEFLKHAFIGGFKWACREGPMCQEMIRRVKFRLIDAELSDEAKFRAPSHIIPGMRNACHAAFMCSSARMMEPWYRVNIQSLPDSLPSTYDLLARRRGHVIKEELVPGTPFTRLDASIPIIDSIGFEFEVRTAASGAALVHAHFEDWRIVTGDPLDRTAITRPLEPADANGLARDFMLKTRKNKSLEAEPNIKSLLSCLASDVIEVQIKRQGLTRAVIEKINRDEESTKRLRQANRG